MILSCAVCGKYVKTFPWDVAEGELRAELNGTT